MEIEGEPSSPDDDRHPEGRQASVMNKSCREPFRASMRKIRATARKKGRETEPWSRKKGRPPKGPKS